MFDISILQKNQRWHIASHLSSEWMCDVPKDVPLDLVDDQISRIFTHLNLYETATQRFWSMDGPVATIPLSLLPYNVVSRGAKAKVNWFSPKFEADYIANTLRRISDTIDILEREKKKYVYYFGMWIPVYGAFAPNGRIMLHYSQKVFWEGEENVAF